MLSESYKNAKFIHHGQSTYFPAVDTCHMDNRYNLNLVQKQPCPVHVNILSGVPKSQEFIKLELVEEH